MYAAQGDLPQALQQYDKALSQHANGHPITAITYTNKGHVLATLGKFQEALEDYRHAQQLNPADRLSAALLHEVERRASAAQDREKQERIDQLVASLLQAYREGKQSPEQGDGWTSVPLTLAFLPVQTQGTPVAQSRGRGGAPAEISRCLAGYWAYYGPRTGHPGQDPGRITAERFGTH